MMQQYLCNNCNCYAENINPRLIECINCCWTLRFKDGLINDCYLDASDKQPIRFQSSLDGSFHFKSILTSKGNTEYINYIILPNIADNVIEIKEYLQKIKNIVILL